MIVLSSLIHLSGCKEERCEDYIIVHIPISGWQPGEEWRSEKDEEKSVSLWNDKAAYITQSYDMDRNLRTTDKQEHLSSQALSSLLSQILSNTISTADISAHILIFFFFLEIIWDLWLQRKSAHLTQSGRSCEMRKTKFKGKANWYSVKKELWQTEINAKYFVCCREVSKEFFM